MLGWRVVEDRLELQGAAGEPTGAVRQALVGTQGATGQSAPGGAAGGQRLPRVSWGTWDKAEMTPEATEVLLGAQSCLAPHACYFSSPSQFSTRQVCSLDSQTLDDPNPGEVGRTALESRISEFL